MQICIFILRRFIKYTYNNYLLVCPIDKLGLSKQTQNVVNLKLTLWMI